MLRTRLYLGLLPFLLLLVGTGGYAVLVSRQLAGSIQGDLVADYAAVLASQRMREAAMLMSATAARAQRGRLTYSSGGVGSTHHLSSALLAQQAQVEFTHVPYRGAPQGILAAQTGEVDFAYFNISTLLTGIRSGALRPLAVTSAARSPFLPDVPTMREQGFPNYEMTTWIGVATMAATPAPILTRMEEALRAMLEDPAVQRRLGELGFEMLPRLSAAEMLPLIRAEHARWGAVIRASGARVE